MLSCLYQLKQENQRLEEHINAMTMRRDRLLAVNARLSIPLAAAAVVNNQPAQQDLVDTIDTRTQQRSSRGTLNNHPSNIAESSYTLLRVSCKNVSLL